MSKSIICTALFMCTLVVMKAQSPITKTVHDDYSLHRIERLDFFRPDRYNRAVNDQLGILGNNIFKDEKLRDSVNPNDDLHVEIGTGDTPTDYFAVNGFKTTLCGKLYLHEFRDGSIDDDLNLEIVCNPKDPVFADQYQKVKDLKYAIYPWAMVEGEIDILGITRKLYDPKTPGLNMPIKFATDVCLHGAWAMEEYQSSEDINPFKGHIDNHEMHPAEQFWWAEKTATGIKYFLNAANDASGRFARTGWAAHGRLNTFGIAFDVRRPGSTKEKLIYKIDIIADNNITPYVEDGTRHYLVKGADTLVEIIEPKNKNILSVQFMDVGLDPFATAQNISDSIIKGIILIQCFMKNSELEYANVKFVVEKKTKTSIQTRPAVLQGKYPMTAQNERPGRLDDALRPHRIKVTLKEISTMENTVIAVVLDRQVSHFMKLVGYIFTEVQSPQTLLSKSSNLSLDGKPQLLFPFLPGGTDDHTRVIFHDDKESYRYNRSITLTLLPNDKLNILSDFVASIEYPGYIHRLQLIENKPFKEISIPASSLLKGMPITKEIILENSKPRSPLEPERKYKMKIVVEFLKLD
jgi:hypothetical protein